MRRPIGFPISSPVVVRDGTNCVAAHSRCTAKSLAQLRLSEVEKANIATLEGIERHKRCR